MQLPMNLFLIFKIYTMVLVKVGVALYMEDLLVVGRPWQSKFFIRRSTMAPLPLALTQLISGPTQQLIYTKMRMPITQMVHLERP